MKNSKRNFQVSKEHNAILVFGTFEAKEKASAEIEGFVQKNLGNVFLVIELPSSSVKKLMTRINDVKKLVGSQTIEFDQSKNTLKIYGNSGLKLDLREKLLQLCKENTEKDCNLCFCEIEEDETVQLSQCGHLFLCKRQAHQGYSCVEASNEDFMMFEEWKKQNDCQALSDL